MWFQEDDPPDPDVASSASPSMSEEHPRSTFFQEDECNHDDYEGREHQGEGSDDDQSQGEGHSGFHESDDEGEESARPAKQGRGKYSRAGTGKRLSFDLQREIALDDDAMDQVMCCKCSCGQGCMGRFSPNFVRECRGLRYEYRWVACCV